MIIDSHAHIGCGTQPWRSDDAIADLVNNARECGIDRLCVSSLGVDEFLHYPDPAQLRAANDQVLAAIERFPDTLLGLCYVSPQHVSASLEEIRRCVAEGPMVGVKLWVAARAADSSLDPLMEEIARLGVHVLQHAFYKSTGNLPDESTPADVAALARRHPEATIQMAHLYGIGERGVLDVADCPNVLIDISGGDAEAGLLEYAVEVVGAERVLFGSDVPGRDFATHIAKVTGADLTEREKQLLLCGNMMRVLRLPIPAT